LALRFNGNILIYTVASIYEFTGIKTANWNYFTSIYPTIYMQSGWMFTLKEVAKTLEQDSDCNDSEEEGPIVRKTIWTPI